MRIIWARYAPSSTVTSKRPAPAKCHAPMPKRMAGHLLGVLLGIRVLARTGAKRKLLESVARPALDLLDGAAGPAGRRNTP